MRAIHAHLCKPPGRIFLSLMQAEKIAGAAAGNIFIYNFTCGDQLLYAFVGKLRFHIYKAGYRRGQLVPGNKAVTVSCIMSKLKYHGCLYALNAVFLHTHSKGQRVGLREGSSNAFGAKYVRIFLYELQSLFAIIFIHAHGEDRAQGAGADKFHQPPHAGLTAQALGHLLGL